MKKPGGTETFVSINDTTCIHGAVDIETGAVSGGIGEEGERTVIFVKGGALASGISQCVKEDLQTVILPAFSGNGKFHMTEFAVFDVGTQEEALFIPGDTERT